LERSLRNLCLHPPDLAPIYEVLHNDDYLIELTVLSSVVYE